MVDYVDTGLSANSVPYSTALAQQRAMHAAVASGRAPDTVILLEHPSVYTAGKRTEPHERPFDGPLALSPEPLRIARAVIPPQT